MNKIINYMYSEELHQQYCVLSYAIVTSLVITLVKRYSHIVKQHPLIFSVFDYLNSQEYIFFYLEHHRLALSSEVRRLCCTAVVLNQNNNAILSRYICAGSCLTLITTILNSYHHHEKKRNRNEANEIEICNKGLSKQFYAHLALLHNW